MQLALGFDVFAQMYSAVLSQRFPSTIGASPSTARVLFESLLSLPTRQGRASWHRSKFSISNVLLPAAWLPGCLAAWLLLLWLLLCPLPASIPAYGLSPSMLHVSF